MEIKRNISTIEAEEQDVLNMLDELYEEVKIGELTFSPSEIIRKLDPVALRCMVADEPVRYECDDCNEMFDDEDEANEHWDDEHKEEKGA